MNLKPITYHLSLISHPSSLKSMALSKKMKKILAGFWALMNRYEKAFESGDREAALQYGLELREYCTKYKKELNFSDEYLAQMKKSYVAYKESLGEEKLANADYEEARREKEVAEREYFKALAQADKNKQIKWN